VDEVRKTVKLGYGLMDDLEFWEYKVTCLDKDNNSGGVCRVHKHVPKI